MKEDIKERWITALDSGEYEQARGALHRAGRFFCALGVLGDLYVKETGKGEWCTPDDVVTHERGWYLLGHYLRVGSAAGSYVSLPWEVLLWAGLPVTKAKRVVEWNDGPEEPRTFSEIAVLVKENL